MRNRYERDSDDYFLMSREWRAVRMLAIERDGGRCNACGRSAHDGIVINVDHIKNRRAHPELALTVSNLQVLCNECNAGKGNRFSTDWRRPDRSVSTPQDVADLAALFRERSLAFLAMWLQTGKPTRRSLDVTQYCVDYHKQYSTFPDIQLAIDHFAEVDSDILDLLLTVDRMLFGVSSLDYVRSRLKT